jgi:hypothetical protein
VPPSSPQPASSAPARASANQTLTIPPRSRRTILAARASAPG